jgi:carbon storage regulator
MLILTRRAGQSIIIGDQVCVTVVGVKGAQIRLGIEAPKNIPVHRREVFERIRREQKARSESAPTAPEVQEALVVPIVNRAA